jgi:hypothetical protein
MSAQTNEPSQVHVRTDSDAASVYKLAQAEELRRLDLQWKEAEGIRTRTAQYLAFVGATTGFLVANAPKSDKGLVLWVFAAVGTALSLLAIYFAWCVSLSMDPRRPRTGRLKWSFKLTAGHTFTFAERQLPRPPDEAQMANFLASKYAEMSELNETALLRLRGTYAKFLVCGALQVIVWAALVWVKA